MKAREKYLEYVGMWSPALGIPEEVSGVLRASALSARNLVEPQSNDLYDCRQEIRSLYAYKANDDAIQQELLKLRLMHITYGVPL